MMPARKVYSFAICRMVVALGIYIATAAAQQPARTGPFTAEQATAGRAIYQSTCAACHLPDMKGSFEAPPLDGGHFLNTWRNRPTSDLFTRIRNTMPVSNPGSLSDQDAVNLVAFILQANGAIAGTQALTAQTIVPIGAVATGEAAVSAQQAEGESAAPQRTGGGPLGLTV